MAPKARAGAFAAVVLSWSTAALGQEGENDWAPSSDPAPSPSAPASSGAQPAGSAPPAAQAAPPVQQPPPWIAPPPPGWPPPPDQPRPPASSVPKKGRPPHVHDGFYLRFALGVGLLRTASSFEGTVGSQPADRAIGDLTYSGHGLAVDAAIGGSPMRGLAIGYGFAWQIADDATLTVENTPSADGETERTEPLGATIHGLLIDVFPNPAKNLELGGLIGIGTVGTGDQNSPSRGIAGAVWAGYGLWAGNQFSLIALLRLGFAHTSSDYARPQTGATSPIDIERADTTFTVGVLTGLLVN
jgi:hypothetical protein